MERDECVKRFHLMQRGKFQIDRQTDMSSILGQRGLISGDYMGSAEFEFGAVPAAMVYMMLYYPKYNLFVTDIKHRNKLDNLLLWCREDWKGIIVDELHNYVEKAYPLKERTGLPELTKPESQFDKEMRLQAKKEGWKREDFSFWWEIQASWNFMVFFSGGKRRGKFLDTIHASYNDWWLGLNNEEREERVQNATRRLRL